MSVHNARTERGPQQSSANRDTRPKLPLAGIALGFIAQLQAFPSSFYSSWMLQDFQTSDQQPYLPLIRQILMHVIRAGLCPGPDPWVWMLSGVGEHAMNFQTLWLSRGFELSTLYNGQHS